MNDRIIIKGFYNTDSATHTYNIPTPTKPIGFKYSNKDVEVFGLVDESEDISGYELNLVNQSFIDARDK